MPTLTMRSPSRFQFQTPSSLRTTGLRRLKTALTPASSTSTASSISSDLFDSTPRSAPSSCSSTGTASPMDTSSDCGCCGGEQHALGLDGMLDSSPSKKKPLAGSAMSYSGAPIGLGVSRMAGARAASNKLRMMLSLRRQRRLSSWDKAVEEERRDFGGKMRVFEPRVKGEVVMMGIFEVLEGGDERVF